MFKDVKLEHEDNKRIIIDAMELIQRRLPGLIHKFKTTHVASLLLLDQQEEVRHMAHLGELLDLDVQPLEGEIHTHLKRLYLEPLKERFQLIWRKIPHKYLTDPLEVVIHKVGSFKNNLEDGLLGALNGDGEERRERRQRQASPTHNDHHSMRPVVHSNILSRAATNARPAQIMPHADPPAPAPADETTDVEPKSPRTPDGSPDGGGVGGEAAAPTPVWAPATTEV